MTFTVAYLSVNPVILGP